MTNIAPNPAQIYSRILTTASYLPEKILTNKDLESIVDTSDEWITTRTGIKSRHIADKNQATSSLAIAAAQKLLQESDIDKNEIDLIVVATCTPDSPFPSVACLVQQALELKNNVAAFDINAACSGFIYGLKIVDTFIKTGAFKKVLLIGSDTMSRILDFNDRNTCVLFGDGAAAVILEASEEPGILINNIYSDGSYGELLNVPFGTSRLQSTLYESDKIQMRGSEVFKVAVNTLSSLALDTLQQAGLSKEDLDLLVPHQANARIIQSTGKKLGLKDEQIIMTVGHHGNTSSASVPLALDYAIKNNRLKRGDNMLLEAFGSGFTWGASLIKY